MARETELGIPHRVGREGWVSPPGDVSHLAPGSAGPARTINSYKGQLAFAVKIFLFRLALELMAKAATINYL